MALTLQIYLLGEYRLLYGDQLVTTVNGDRQQSLLAYLLLHRDAPQSRQHLATLLWPNSVESQARTNLRNLLHQVRQALPDADRFITANTSTLQWRLDAPFTLDVAEFQRLLADANAAVENERQDEARMCLEAATALYQGDLLPGIYDDWLMVIREEVRRLYLDGLEQLARLFETAEDHRSAIRTVQRLLHQDPLNETTYVQLMRLHALSGDRAGVQRAYDTCVATLQRELDVEPSSATQQAYRSFLRLDAVQFQALPTFIASPHNLPSHLPSQGAVPPPAPAPKRRRLPTPVMPLVGRIEELAEVAELLSRRDCRLLTLVGPGGIGKTRLALQAASDHMPIFADGVVFVPLAGVATADLIVPAMMDALQLNARSAIDPVVPLVAYLGDKECLLVLDNVEQLLDGIDVLADLLQQTPHTKLLVTSRERLNLQEEWVYDLRGLPVPGEQDQFLEENTAAALFLQHARRTRRDFTLGPQDYDGLRRICRLVEGMPLALELAGSWARMLTCAEIAQEIERSLDFLATTQRGAPGRHQSMRAVFEHSWALLSHDEQAIFARLALFRGGFDRAAGERVAGASLPVLLALVDKSLVRRAATDRFDLHELLRQYAAEKLAARGETATIQAVHAAYYLTLAEEAARHTHSKQKRQWLERLERDHDNLRAALRWALDHDGEIALRLAAALPDFWSTRGHISEARAWLAQTLERNPAPSPARAHALLGAGNFAQHQGEYATAQMLLAEGERLLREMDDRFGIAKALRAKGWLVFAMHSRAAAVEFFEESLRLFRELNDPARVADLLTCLAMALQTAEPARAETYLQESLAIFRVLHYSEGVASVLNIQSGMASAAGNYTLAAELAREALVIFRALDAKKDLAWTNLSLGEIAWFQSDLAVAQMHWEEALRFLQELGIKGGVLLALHHQGQVQRRLGNLDAATQLYSESLRLCRSLNNQMMTARTLAGLGGVALAQGEWVRAATLLGGAYALLDCLAPFLAPADQAEYDVMVDAVRRELPEERFNAAWAQGAALPVTELVALALREAIPA